MLPRTALIRLLLIGCTACLPACSGGGSEACAADGDCPAGRYCQAGTCGYDCTFDSECHSGYLCTVRGRCELGCTETNGGREACDGQDNDCDGQVDEEFEQLGEVCQNGGCPPGLMVCTADGSDLTCDGQVPEDEDATCDGLDQDCDGQTDEDALDRPCPLNVGVCQGAAQRCEGGAWTTCDYGPSYTAGMDATCDNLDEDCDGQIDEDAGIVPIPEVGAEAVDGVDNNCSGVIDEPGGIMVPVPGRPQVAIDAYEVVVSDAPDCSGTRYGSAADDFPAGFPAEGELTETLYACSLPGVLPSGHLSWYRARWACEAQGKRLCANDEYNRTCAGDPPTPYPYGYNYINGACNCGWDEPRQLAETGSFPDCRSGDAWDMSGNLSEWISDHIADRPEAGMVVGFGYVCETCPWGSPCVPCDPDDPDQPHRIEMAADCLAEEIRWYEGFDRSEVKPYLGTRCCWDMP